MGAYALEIAIAVITTVCTTIAGLVVKHFYKKAAEKEEQAKREAQAKIDEANRIAQQQKEDYERLLKEEQTRNNRKMILDEIDPLVVELNRIKLHIEADEKEFEQRIKDVKNRHDSDKGEFDGRIRDLAEKHEENLSMIRESYKFRFIQLCKSHLKDGYITDSEFEQIVAFYNLYHSLGGNGQAEDYYKKVKELQVIPDDEVE